MHARLFLFLGSLSAALSVALGAIGAHVFADRPPHLLALFQTALQYQQHHALGLIAVGLLATRFNTRPVIAAGWLMIAGTVLFSGNLYLRSLAGIDTFHAVTPFGGGAFILAWLSLALGVLVAPRGS